MESHKPVGIKKRKKASTMLKNSSESALAVVVGEMRVASEVIVEMEKKKTSFQSDKRINRM